MGRDAIARLRPSWGTWSSKTTCSQCVLKLWHMRFPPRVADETCSTIELSVRTRRGRRPKVPIVHRLQRVEVEPTRPTNEKHPDISSTSILSINKARDSSSANKSDSVRCIPQLHVESQRRRHNTSSSISRIACHPRSGAVGFIKFILVTVANQIQASTRLAQLYLCSPQLRCRCDHPDYQYHHPKRHIWRWGQLQRGHP